MSRKQEKPVIRLNTQELLKAAMEHDLTNDTQIAAKLGVSVTQLWRVKLPVSNPQHNSPGTGFIAGVLTAFDAPFEEFFFLD